MLKLFRRRRKQKSTIDTLVRQQADLEVEKQEIRDAQNEKNSKLENKIQQLENEACRNKQIADSKIADIDRLIQKGQEQMALEAKYYTNLTNDIRLQSLNVRTNPSAQDTKRGA